MAEEKSMKSLMIPNVADEEWFESPKLILCAIVSRELLLKLQLDADGKIFPFGWGSRFCDEL